MPITIKRAERQRQKFRLAIAAPSGAGKTYTAIAIALTLGKRVLVIDTERGSASLYADEWPGSQFDVIELDSYSPRYYIEAMKIAGTEGYDAVVIDSLSHAWSGAGGALDMVDEAMVKSKSNNKFTAWREITPLHNELVDTMLQSPFHLIATMRSKTEYVLEDRNGKKVPRKVGMAPIQRDGMEYEFTMFGEMDLDHNLIISKSRITKLDGAVVNKPGAAFAGSLLDWLATGSEVLRPATAVAPPRAAAATAPVHEREPGEDDDRDDGPPPRQRVDRGEDVVPGTVGLDTDPDITDAFAAAGFSAVKKRAWLNRAVEKGLSKGELLRQIPPPARAPAAATAAPPPAEYDGPPAAEYDDDF